MNINEVKLYFEALINKDQSGNTITPTQFNLFAQRAQMELFEQLYKNFESTQEITDSMHEFLVPGLLNVDQVTGRAPYPSDYIHTASIRKAYYKNNILTERPVKQVKNADWATTLSSNIVTPTAKRPVMTYYSAYMQFAPKNVGGILLDYFKKPADPKWAFTMTAGRPVYDSANSVDFQMPDNTLNEIVFMMASYMGINLRENDLIQYSELQKQKQQLS